MEADVGTALKAGLRVTGAGFVLPGVVPGVVFWPPFAVPISHPASNRVDTTAKIRVSARIGFFLIKCSLVVGLYGTLMKHGDYIRFCRSPGVTLKNYPISLKTLLIHDFLHKVYEIIPKASFYML